jgi:hypothetical protein
VMPVALTTAPEPMPPAVPRRRRWTHDECAMLVEKGTWEREKLGLIDGELISKTGQNRPHVLTLTRIMQWLVGIFGWGRVNLNAPIDVTAADNPINEPEPDVIVLTPSSANLRSANFEIADSTLRFDLNVRARLYARAGIVEHRVVDVPGRRLIVHCDPVQTATARIARRRFVLIREAC